MQFNWTGASVLLMTTARNDIVTGKKKKKYHSIGLLFRYFIT